jgi:23S rRNA pseudouridine2605 synthase
MGFCSRSQAVELVLDGRVRLQGAVCRDPGRAVDLTRYQIEVNGQPIREARKIYLMLNKPRGLVTTVSDDQGRATVFDCLPADLPFISPVGRLDKASEGLLLFTNDTKWAARVTEPLEHLDKTYHVQIDRSAEDTLLQRMVRGVHDRGDSLSAKQAAVLRSGPRNSWLTIVLDEGKNRHIRRLLEALDVRVLRLVRVAIGPLQLGDLPKGSSRVLTETEVQLYKRACA